MQDLWQAHYQILPIFFHKEFIELNVNLDTMINNLKLVEFKISIATVFLNTQILTEYKCLTCNKTCQTKFDKKLKERFITAHKFFNHDNNKFVL